MIVEIEHAKIYFPKEDRAPNTLFVFVHGGEWIFGSIEQHEQIGDKMASSGFKTALVRYPLAEVRYGEFLYMCKYAGLLLLSLLLGFACNLGFWYNLPFWSMAILTVYRTCRTILDMRRTCFCRQPGFETMVKHLHENIGTAFDIAKKYDDNITRIVVAGHEAGAHLVSLLPYAKAARVLPIKCYICASGIYSLPDFYNASSPLQKWRLRLLTLGSVIGDVSVIPWTDRVQTVLDEASALYCVKSSTAIKRLPRHVLVTASDDQREFTRQLFDFSGRLCGHTPSTYYVANLHNYTRNHPESLLWLFRDECLRLIDL